MTRLTRQDLDAAALSAMAGVALPATRSRAEAVRPQRGGTLTLLVEPEPPTLSTIAHTAGSALKVSAKVLEGLLAYDEELNPQPQLATACRTWRLHAALTSHPSSSTSTEIGPLTGRQKQGATMPIHADGVILPYKLQGQGKGVLQEVSIAGSPHTIRAEGPPPFGGTDSAPSPLDYVLAALVSCNQVTSQIVALGKNIKLGRFDGRVEAEFDNSVLVYGAEGNPNFSSIKLTVELETELEDAAFDEFVAEVARRCPVTQLITRSGVAFTSEWKNRTLVHS